MVNYKLTQVSRKAWQVHKKAIVIDAHCDVALKLVNNNLDIGRRHKTGHFDLPRAFEGGLNAVFFSIFVPGYKNTLEACKSALEQIDAIYRAVENNADCASLALTSQDIVRLSREGKIAILMGMENSNPIGVNTALLRDFYRLGVRYLVPGNVATNYASNLSFYKEWAVTGLGTFGKEIINEMNALGMVIDLSHLSEQARWEALEVSRTPVIVSHTACNSLCKTITRNLSDEFIHAIAENGGVIHITFSPDLLDQALRDKNLESRSRLLPQLRLLRKKYSNDESAYIDTLTRLMAKQGFTLPGAPIIIDHIEHVIKLVGVSHVGLGSDFDGTVWLPKGIENVSKLPIITHLLLERGYSEEDVIKILGKNIIRVMKKNEQFAVRACK